MKEFIEANGYAPSFRETGEAVGITVGAVAYHAWKLKALGRIDFVPNKARTVHIVD